jgi:hypothetical protein
MASATTFLGVVDLMRKAEDAFIVEWFEYIPTSGTDIARDEQFRDSA